MSILKDLNYIKKMTVMPCAVPDWQVIIETGFRSAPPALLSLFVPGCTDIIKTRVGLSPWHLKGVSGILKKATKPEAISGVKFLYKIGYFTAEKYLWWFMVADVTTDFVTTWQSMVFQMQQCELPGAGGAYGKFSPFVYIPGQSGRLAWSTDKAQHGVVAAGGECAILPGFEASISWSAEWDSWPVRGQGVSVSTSLEKLNNNEISDYMHTNDPNLRNGNNTLGSIYSQEIGSILPDKYVVNYTNDGDNFAQVINSRWNVSLSGRSAGTVPWGCKPKPVSWPFP